MLRIGELAAATGVSIQTIHYYLRDGLLLPPVKTARNMAYYGLEYVEDIQLIKELQQKRFLPLSVIRLVLEAKRAGKDLVHLQDMSLSLEELFRPSGPEEEIQPVDSKGLADMVGLPAATLQALESIGLLIPSVTPEGKLYDGLALRIVRLIKQLLDMGLGPSDLDYYRVYIESLRTEARVVHDKILHSPGRTAWVSGKEIKETLESLRAAVTMHVQRQVVLELHNDEDATQPRSDRQ